MKTYFIRKNTPELLEKIERLGVLPCICAKFEGWGWLVFDEYGVHGISSDQCDIDGHYDGDLNIDFSYNNFLSEIGSDYTDCGENEEMFLNYIKDNMNNILPSHRIKKTIKLDEIVKSVIELNKSNFNNTDYPYECVIKETGRVFTPILIDYENKSLWWQKGQASENGEWVSFEDVIFIKNVNFIELV